MKLNNELFVRESEQANVGLVETTSKQPLCLCYLLMVESRRNSKPSWKKITYNGTVAFISFWFRRTTPLYELDERKYGVVYHSFIRYTANKTT